MQMNNSSLVELSDVAGKPRVILALPVPLRIGDRIHLVFQLRRIQGGRSEILDVSGDFRVTAVGFDASSGTGRQVLAVDTTGKTLVWRAVKKQPVFERKLGPTRFPKTLVS